MKTYMTTVDVSAEGYRLVALIAPTIHTALDAMAADFQRDGAQPGPEVQERIALLHDLACEIRDIGSRLLEVREERPLSSYFPPNAKVTRWGRIGR